MEGSDTSRDVMGTSAVEQARGCGSGRPRGLRPARMQRWGRLVPCGSGIYFPCVSPHSLVVGLVLPSIALLACGSSSPPASDGCALGCAPSASAATLEPTPPDPKVATRRPSASTDDGPVSGARNVLGTALQVCGTSPMTGWFRDGQCRTDEADRGSHTVCALVTDEFLSFTASKGNDLVTPRGGFPGLRAGDRWCLCDGRFAEADRAGVAPPIVLEATHEAALRRVERARLEARAVR
jgi:uncharacterized protein (DUF2237 family)